MKKVMILAVALFLAPTVYGQIAPDELFDQYSGKDGYRSIHITRHMFQLFADLDVDEEVKEFIGMASSIERVKVLIAESDSADSDRARELYKDAMRTLPISQYRELLVARESDQIIKMLVREEGKIVSEFLMLVNDEPIGIVLSLTGDIDLNQLVRILSKMDIYGLGEDLLGIKGAERDED